jgi:predicted  nucleic acid-binding Zn-ribbon protein
LREHCLQAIHDELKRKDEQIRQLTRDLADKESELASYRQNIETTTNPI